MELPSSSTHTLTHPTHVHNISVALRNETTTVQPKSILLRGTQVQVHPPELHTFIDIGTWRPKARLAEKAAQHNAVRAHRVLISFFKTDMEISNNCVVACAVTLGLKFRVRARVRDRAWG